MYPSCRSERSRGLDARRTVRFVLAAAVFSRVPAELPMPGGAATASCAAESPRIVRLLVVNEAGVAPSALDAAAAEAGTIWAGAGVRLAWTFAPTSFERTDDDTVVVVIRRALRTPAASGQTEPPVSHALGRISFGADGRPAGLIEVSFDAVTGLVMAGSQFDRPIPTLPLANRLAMVGRGLGRVVAHELGHWLAGRGHARFGVMKAGFDTRDLVESITPLLPPAWRALLGGAGAARSPRCDRAPVPGPRGAERPDAATCGQHRAMRAGPKAGAPQ
jgi:hypothetical protein